MVGQAPTPPILIVVNNTTANPLGGFYEQILRAEGINSFAIAQLSSLSLATLDDYRLAILAETALTASPGVDVRQLRQRRRPAGGDAA